MRSGKWNSLHTVLLSAVIAGIAASGCKKGSDLEEDNNKVIRTPYSVYFSNMNGALYNTNDGQAYKQVFGIDGYPGRALISLGSNLLWAKENLHLSKDGGYKFNPVNRDLHPKATWQSLIINAGKSAFLATRSGIQESKDSGDVWEAGTHGNPLDVISFARLSSGVLYASDLFGGIWELKDLNPTTQWTSIGAATPYPAGVYHLTNFNNSLIAGDTSGANGVWYSANGGVDWAQYSGLPLNQEIRSMHSPLGQGLLVGLDSAGIYRLVNDVFEPSNSGLKPFTTVYGIASKQDIYKNEVIRQYVYIATSTGLYRSEDLGKNWALMMGGQNKNGQFRLVY